LDLLLVVEFFFGKGCMVYWALKRNETGYTEFYTCNIRAAWTQVEWLMHYDYYGIYIISFNTLWQWAPNPCVLDLIGPGNRGVINFFFLLAHGKKKRGFGVFWDDIWNGYSKLVNPLQTQEPPCSGVTWVLSLSFIALSSYATVCHKYYDHMRIRQKDFELAVFRWGRTCACRFKGSMICNAIGSYCILPAFGVYLICINHTARRPIRTGRHIFGII